MRTFTLIWFGQLVSTLGTYMTFFALTLWAWDTTGSATALALVGFFSQLPKIPTTLFAGLIVDRFNRKYLMLLGDVVAALSTIIIGVLYLTQQLHIWHLYAVVIFSGSFGQIQTLAYQASISMMVPKRHYTRTGSMASIVHYGSNIVGPALAGILYPLIGLSGIILVDLFTFAIAFATLLAATIPQPKQSSEPDQLINTLTFGFRHVWQQPSLKALLLITILFTLAHDLGRALYSPMILARTNGSAQALASISAIAGVGGVVGAIVVSLWGGPKRRINGVLGGYIGAGLSKTIFGLGQSLTVWLPAQLCSSLNFPLLGSARSALWMDKISPNIQGRIFAANSLIIQATSALAALLAGPLADGLLEPAMMPGRPLSHLLSPSFGSGPGAGMAVLYTLCAVMMLLVGIGGFLIPSLRAIETRS
ncbi:major facilitator superfamily mfs-1 [Leptolyngbya sp. Heron Island J]|uniref:MFS transporter n=1 Tax=Leptolyngbya sp. Heron Island J TaxID=1385935 RepID=UPI0003B982AF|nr:MFS transporter [Leptolyngbya sp. Heron Island J]ESA33903.1 major facilitator superfamily mfs-1 [Leptolyngbya sp. Heron Island J]